MPQLSARELAEFVQDPLAEGVILDVREAWELAKARLDDPRVIHLPLSQLQRMEVSALPDSIPTSQKILVLCHHGQRSALVTSWLRSNGLAQASNIEGGIAAYSRLSGVDLNSY